MFDRKLHEQRAALLAQNRALHDKAKTENRDFNADEKVEFEKRMADISAISARIQREEDLSRMEAEQGKPPAAAPAPASEFRSFGEFLYAARFDRQRLQARELSMGTGAEGGFNVPEQFRPELLKLDPTQIIVRPRATVIPAGDPPDAKVNMPAIDHTTNVYGGATVTWISEGGAKNSTDIDFKEVSLEPKEVACYVTVSDKLLRNWQAASSVIGKMLRGAIQNAEDHKFLTGAVPGAPQGVLAAPCKLNVVRNGAGLFKWVDAAAMLAKMPPNSMGKACWVLSQSLHNQVTTMLDTGNTSIFVQGDATKGVSSTLLGLPVFFTGKVPAAGNEGDAMLCDFSYYLIKDGSGPFVAASEHVNFVNNKTVIKAFWNVDGGAWPQTVLTLEDGATQVSPFVVLL